MGKKDDEIINDYLLNQIKNINEMLKNIDEKYFISCDELSEMNEKAESLLQDKANISVYFSTLFNDFIESYKKLIIVNPTKQKFSETVLDIHFYELMRMYSNSLEKENTILFVMGFSFADEHIRDITIRAANTNPTLLVVIFAFGEEGTDKESHDNYKILVNNNKNSNIVVLTPSKFKETNKDENDAEKKVIINSITNFDLATINSVFSLINKEIPRIYDK